MKNSDGDRVYWVSWSCIVVGRVFQWDGLGKNVEKWKGIPTQETKDSSCSINEFDEWMNESRHEVIYWTGDLGITSILQVNEGQFRQI